MGLPVIVQRDETESAGIYRYDLVCTVCGCERIVAWLTGVDTRFRDDFAKEFHLEHRLCEPGHEIDIVTGESVG